MLVGILGPGERFKHEIGVFAVLERGRVAEKHMLEDLPAF